MFVHRETVDAVGFQVCRMQPQMCSSSPLKLLNPMYILVIGTVCTISENMKPIVEILDRTCTQTVSDTLSTAMIHVRCPEMIQEEFEGWVGADGWRLQHACFSNCCFLVSLRSTDRGHGCELLLWAVPK